MPFKSAKQRRMIYAAAAGKSKKMSKRAAKKFIRHSKQRKSGRSKSHR